MKRVLFVDDEQAILDGLRTRLHRATEWEMAFAGSGAQALQELERKPFDVIITDMKMPQMDGGQLLNTVSVRWPHIVRMVLSGCGEMQETISLVPVAHQFLSKPCETQQLRNRIERSLALQELLTDPNLRAIVGRIRKLPAIPSTYARLQAAMSCSTASVQDIGTIIATDAVLSARVLQMVNSAFFRLARRITNISQAVSYLGFTAVRNLVLSVEVFSCWSQGSSQNSLNLETLQQHVLRVAAVANALTEGTEFVDDTLLAALLHDIGYWVLAQELAPQLQAAIDLARSEGIPLHEAETRIIGASHAELGAYLLGIWGLPYPVIEAVAHHHSPQRICHQEFDVLSAMALAHSLADEREAAAFGMPNRVEPLLEEDNMEALCAPFTWAEAQRRVAHTLKSGALQS
jgi:putative nucleotidyltransferase with HDIG domain